MDRESRPMNDLYREHIKIAFLFDRRLNAIKGNVKLFVVLQSLMDSKEPMSLNELIAVCSENYNIELDCNELLTIIDERCVSINKSEEGITLTEKGRDFMQYIEEDSQKIQKEAFEWFKEEMSNFMVREEIKRQYLFSWDNVPGNDSKRLRKFLLDDLDISWAENAEIRKSADGKTIRIFKGDNSAEIMIDEKKKRASLKIHDGEIHNLKVKMKNGKLTIYITEDIYNLFVVQKILRDSKRVMLLDEVKRLCYEDYKIELVREELLNIIDKYYAYIDSGEEGIALTERGRELMLFVDGESKRIKKGEFELFKGEVYKFLVGEKIKKFLFSWDNVPRNVSGRLLKFLRDELGVRWAGNAEIRKSADGKTIRIFKGDNSVEIMIDETKERATLKISDGGTRDLKVKQENGKLNIYLDHEEKLKYFFIKTVSRVIVVDVQILIWMGSSNHRQLNEGETFIDAGRCIRRLKDDEIFAEFDYDIQKSFFKIINTLFEGPHDERINRFMYGLQYNSLLRFVFPSNEIINILKEDLLNKQFCLDSNTILSAIFLHDKNHYLIYDTFSKLKQFNDGHLPIFWSDSIHKTVMNVLRSSKIICENMVFFPDKLISKVYINHSKSPVKEYFMENWSDWMSFEKYYMNRYEQLRDYDKATKDENGAIINIDIDENLVNETKAWFKAYLDQRGFKKSADELANDSELLVRVHLLRQHDKSGSITPNYWIITMDASLINFEKQFREIIFKSEEYPLCVSKRALTLLLDPYFMARSISVTDTFDRSKVSLSASLLGIDAEPFYTIEELNEIYHQLMRSSTRGIGLIGQFLDAENFEELSGGDKIE